MGRINKVLLIFVLVFFASVSVARAANDEVDLGFRVDKMGRVVQGKKFIHYANPAKPSNPGGKGGLGGSCYAYLAKGAKWQTFEGYYVNPGNDFISSGDVENILASGISKWETAAGKDIFGNQLGEFSGVRDFSSPDGENDVMFGNIDTSGVIAVTYVWGVFSGPTWGRYLSEWDQIYDDVDFVWSTSGEPGKMDFDNIATHELGHAFGMGHPSDICTEETMYRYADFGETKKRDLNTGDTEGIFNLYK